MIVLESPGNNTVSCVSLTLTSGLLASLCLNAHMSHLGSVVHVARARHWIHTSSSAPQLTLCSDLSMEINNFKLHYFDKSWLKWWICAPAKGLVCIFWTHWLGDDRPAVYDRPWAHWFIAVEVNHALITKEKTAKKKTNWRWLWSLQMMFIYSTLSINFIKYTCTIQCNPMQLLT